MAERAAGPEQPRPRRHSQPGPGGFADRQPQPGQDGVPGGSAVPGGSGWPGRQWQPGVSSFAGPQRQRGGPQRGQPPGAPQPVAPRPGAPQWQGNLDDLWPPFGSPYRQPGQSKEQQRAQAKQQQFYEHMQEARRRRPDQVRPRLTREEIVDAAIAIADAEGADALSMRRIAQVLRAGTMSLYWHVASKEHLLDLMRDMLMAEVSVPKPSGDWSADLRAMAVSLRVMLSRHRWLMDFVGGRPPLGPNTILRLEANLMILAQLNLDLRARMDVLTAITTYVSGVVLRETQEIRAQEAEQEEEEGLDLPRALAERQAWRDRLAATGLFSHVVGFIDAQLDPDAPETMDARFEFGLDCLLDGIAAKLATS
jgi:AcrR family transcriptional regulator